MTRPMIVILRTVLCRSLVEYIIALVNISYKHVRCQLDWFPSIVHIFILCCFKMFVQTRETIQTLSAVCECGIS